MSKSFSNMPKIRNIWGFNPSTRVKPAKGEKIYKRSDTRRIERDGNVSY